MIEEFLNDKLCKVQKMLKPIDWDHWGLNKVTIALEFYPIPYSNASRTAFVQTGSFDMPSGISTINNCFVLFFDPKNEGLPFYCTVDLLKKYMKDNFEIISKNQDMSEEFDGMGYVIDVEHLFVNCDETPLIVTSP